MRLFVNIVAALLTCVRNTRPKPVPDKPNSAVAAPLKLTVDPVVRVRFAIVRSTWPKGVDVIVVPAKAVVDVMVLKPRLSETAPTFSVVLSAGAELTLNVPPFSVIEAPLKRLLTLDRFVLSSVNVE